MAVGPLSPSRPWSSFLSSAAGATGPSSLGWIVLNRKQRIEQGRKVLIGVKLDPTKHLNQCVEALLLSVVCDRSIACGARGKPVFDSQSCFVRPAAAEGMDALAILTRSNLAERRATLGW